MFESNREKLKSVEEEIAELEARKARVSKTKALNELNKQPAPEKEPVHFSIFNMDTLPPITFELPSSDLLDPIPPRFPYNEQELKKTSARIEDKIRENGIEGKVVQIYTGPVLNTFEYEPATPAEGESGIKYARLKALNEDIAEMLGVESVMSERIPGTKKVGIEVPNANRQKVGLREIVESDDFERYGINASSLPIAMGKDVCGYTRVASLESMPHLLIGGTFDSGQPAMLDSIIASTIYAKTPEEVRMVVIDPTGGFEEKYEGLPHLQTPVITNAEKGILALRDCVEEMERRMRVFAHDGVRNIDQYNKKALEEKSKQREMYVVQQKEILPRIVIVIDELANLMMQPGSTAEESITRLAQMARATGMHMVISTLNPKTDVVTGLIKANFPARICMKVESRVDSRTILDVSGAEDLLGKGDMLFLPTGSSTLVRIQGTSVSEKEIKNLVDFYRAQVNPDIKRPVSSAREKIVDIDTSTHRLFQEDRESMPTNKDRAVLALEKTIRVNEKIIADAIKELQEIQERMRTKKIKAEKMIASELTTIQESLQKRLASYHPDQKVIEFLEKNLRLLQLDPVVYFTRKREEAEKTLAHLSKMSYKKDAKEDREKSWIASIKKYQEIIDGLITKD